jgi:hypothetical protein
VLNECSKPRVAISHPFLDGPVLALFCFIELSEESAAEPPALNAPSFEAARQMLK